MAFCPLRTYSFMFATIVFQSLLRCSNAIQYQTTQANEGIPYDIFSHVMAYSTSHDQLIIAGGRVSTNSSYNDATYLMNLSTLTSDYSDNSTANDLTWNIDTGHNFSFIWGTETIYEWDEEANSTMPVNITVAANVSVIVGWGEVLSNRSFYGQSSVTYDDIIYAWEQPYNRFLFMPTMFDPLNRTWLEGEQLSADLDIVDLDGVCVALDTDRDVIYAIGEAFGNLVVMQYDPDSDEWSSYSTFPALSDETRIRSQCVYKNDNIYIFGGYDPYSGSVSDAIYKFNVASSTWTELPDTLYVPRYLGRALVIDGYALIMGGTATTSLYHSMVTTEVFDFDTESVIGWGPSFVESRSMFGAEWVEDKRILFISGGYNHNNPVNSWEFMDLREWNLTYFIQNDGLSKYYVYDSYYLDYEILDYLTDGMLTDDFQEALQLSRAHSTAEIVIISDIDSFYDNIIYVDDGISSLHIYPLEGTRPYIDITGDTRWLHITVADDPSIEFQLSISGLETYTQSTAEGSFIYVDNGDNENLVALTASDLYMTHYAWDDTHAFYIENTYGNTTITGVTMYGIAQYGYVGIGPAIYVEGDVILTNSYFQHMGGSGSATWAVIALNFGTVFVDNIYMISNTGAYTSQLYVWEASHVQISNIYCEDNPGWWGSCLTLDTCNDTYIQGVTAINNTGARGTGIKIYYPNSDMYISDLTFIDNYAYYGGAFAVTVRSDSQHLTIERAYFERCVETVSGFGGAIDYEGLSMDCINCTFIDNYSPVLGGAVTISAYDWCTFENCVFRDNLAGKDGGAIAINNGYLNLENCTIENNIADQGGAIAFIVVSEMPLRIRNSEIAHNIASAHGGAINMFGGIYDIEGLNCHDNVAKSNGGCLYDGNSYYECRANQSIITNSVFTNNIAQQGAAIFVRGCNFELSDSNFTNNYASSLGGALMMDAPSGNHNLTRIIATGNEAGRSGGALVFTGGDIHLIDSVISNNMASDMGAGLYMRDALRWPLKGHIIGSSITNNTSEEGAGIGVESDHNTYQWSDEPLLSIEYTTISHNTAGDSGGAIDIDKGTVLSSQCVIKDNTAVYGGGVNFEMGWYKDIQSNFSGNVAAEKGGGVRIENTQMQLNGSRFEGNEAKYGGGAYVAKCLSYDSYDLNFANNDAEYSGGAIHNEESDCDEWCNGECVFENNIAAFGGDQSSDPVSMTISFNVPSEVTRTKLLSPVCAIYDKYDTLVTSLEFATVATVSVISDSGVNLTGLTSTTFTDGEADLAFYIKPMNHLQYTEQKLELELEIVSSLYDFSQRFNLTYAIKIYDTPPGVIAISAILAILGLISVGTCFYLLWRFQREAIIRGATLPFLWIILFGCVLLCIFIIVAPLAPQSADCTSQIWLLHFAFLLVVAPIGGKTWRIYMIFHMAKKRIQKVDWTTSRLALFFVGLPCLAMLFYMMIWTLVQDWHNSWQILGDGTALEYCQYNVAFGAISCAVALCCLGWLVRLAIGVREVPKNFNESRWLGASIYTLGIIFCFMIPIIVIRSISYTAKQVFVVVACFMVLEAILVFLFGVKFYLIWTGQATVKAIRKPRAVSQTGQTDWSKTGGSMMPSTTAASGVPTRMTIGSMSGGTEMVSQQPTLTSGLSAEGMGSESNLMSPEVKRQITLPSHSDDTQYSSAREP